nr:MULTISPECIES: hypothetical protein [Pseudomonas]
MTVLLTVGVLAVLILLINVFFGAAVGAALAVVATRFNLFWLLVSLVVLALAGFLQFNATPDPTQWMSVIDSVAQSHLLGIPVPAITATVGLGVLILAFWLAEKDKNRF